MSVNTDVLTEHAELIAASRAGGAELEYYIPSRVGACILALAAEVRAQRETIRELQAWGEAMVDDARVGREAREKESRGIA